MCGTSFSDYFSIMLPIQSPCVVLVSRTISRSCYQYNLLCVVLVSLTVSPCYQYNHHVWYYFLGLFLHVTKTISMCGTSFSDYLSMLPMQSSCVILFLRVTNTIPMCGTSFSDFSMLPIQSPCVVLVSLTIYPCYQYNHHVWY